ncbi:hypothetical protein YH64_027120 [Achromobacter sp. LC458]|uniref:hypothetical protein n=1 Tax=unclassified Achromobacter TaxID=2626865 RepID=UPI000629EF8F|nr:MULTISPECIES: hypothetical protein [unclassified Achromobacter]AYD64081.1 hypothetical protein DVB37_09230 [Achromobacter sp. B7]MDX3985856.1 hypothetical protein [Achromobacter sp.]QYJ23532.1 hypothetical protein KYT87_10070 [Achromobacter sp. ES-001]TRM49879.1 hypothetical protein YH64_027120 [Achromobacter sp. LC458]HBL65249.1 hypothetical protein [Achromobacter sp.]
MSARHTKGRTGRGFMFVWGAPILLGVLSVFGLLAALLGTGAWHWASWITLTILLGVIVRYWVFPLKH